jgi:hypothetical protein
MRHFTLYTKQTRLFNIIHCFMYHSNKWDIALWYIVYRPTKRKKPTPYLHTLFSLIFPHIAYILLFYFPLYFYLPYFLIFLSHFPIFLFSFSIFSSKWHQPMYRGGGGWGVELGHIFQIFNPPPQRRRVLCLLISFWLVMGSSRMELGAEGRVPSENMRAILITQDD